MWVWVWANPFPHPHLLILGYLFVVCFVEILLTDSLGICDDGNRLVRQMEWQYMLWQTIVGIAFRYCGNIDCRKFDIWNKMKIYQYFRSWTEVRKIEKLLQFLLVDSFLYFFVLSCLWYFRTFFPFFSLLISCSSNFFIVFLFIKFFRTSRDRRRKVKILYVRLYRKAYGMIWESHSSTTTTTTKIYLLPFSLL